MTKSELQKQIDDLRAEIQVLQIRLAAAERKTVTVVPVDRYPWGQGWYPGMPQVWFSTSNAIELSGSR